MRLLLGVFLFHASELTYDRFKEMFDKYSREAGKEQYLIPYFIAAHLGTTDNDMLNLALWLKRNGFRADQVQAFLPSPMSIAAMYHSGKDTVHKVSRTAEDMSIPKSIKQRRLHKAFLRFTILKTGLYRVMH